MRRQEIYEKCKNSEIAGTVVKTYADSGKLIITLYVLCTVCLC
jgi:hypothetical protein